MFKNGKVLLATDFSKTAEMLSECLLELKKTGIEEVLLVHVINYRKSAGSVIELKKNYEEKLADVKKKVEKMGLDASVRVEIGHPHDEIMNIAQEENCQLILIASHGRGVVKQIFLGSTTYNVVRKSNIPVLVEKYKNIDRDDCQIACENKFDRVLLPIDFSDCAQEVLDMVKKMHYTSEEIILVSIIESSEDLEELDAKKEKARNKLKDISKELKENNISNQISIEVRDGAASHNIIEVAEEKDAGLIIMSKRGTGYLKGLLIGSTADRVTRESPVPVMLVPCNKSE
ncbi:MAG: universal stress protein [Halanaerobiales bacterium]|nr:universal stress protein [Halanaerobiales bacterium]